MVMKERMMTRMVSKICRRFMQASLNLLLAFVGKEEENEDVSSDEDDVLALPSDGASLTFSREKGIKYVRRFEEGYDLPDSRYWVLLSINHCDAVQTELVTPSLSTTFTQSTPNDTGLAESRPTEMSTLPGPGIETQSEPVSTLPDQLTPNQVTVEPGLQLPVATPTVAPLEPTPMSSCTRNSSSEELSMNSTPRHSPLSDLVNIPSIQPKKSGFA